MSNARGKAVKGLRLRIFKLSLIRPPDKSVLSKIKVAF